MDLYKKIYHRIQSYSKYKHNNAIFRKQLIEFLHSYLSSIKYYNAKIVCDDTNNSFEVINSNGLRVDTFRKDIYGNVEHMKFLV